MEQRRQDVEDPGVQRLHGDEAGVEHQLDRLGTVGQPEDVDVITCVQVAVGVVRGAEVRDDEPVEAELVAQHPLKECLILAVVGPVHLVVRAHHRGGVALLDGGLEGNEIDLVQGALIHQYIDKEPPADRAARDGDAELALLVVSDVVLDVGHDALRLESVDPADGSGRAEVGVLPVALIRPASERRSHDVDGRSVDPVVALELGVASDRRAVEVRLKRIEAGGQGDAGGERRCHAASNSQRAIGEVDRGDTQ